MHTTCTPPAWPPLTLRGGALLALPTPLAILALLTPLAILAIYWRYTGDILAHSPYSPYRPSLPPQDLTSVRDIMTQNIQDVLGRGEALDCAPGWG